MKGLSLGKDYLGDEDVDAVQYNLPYIHRWTKEYDDLLLYKLYNHQWHYHLHPELTPNYTMMITLTGTHASPRYPQNEGSVILHIWQNFTMPMENQRTC